MYFVIDLLSLPQNTITPGSLRNVCGTNKTHSGVRTQNRNVGVANVVLLFGLCFDVNLSVNDSLYFAIDPKMSLEFKWPTFRGSV